MEAKLLVLSFLLGSATAVPLGDWSSNCATTCKPSQKFNYETGKTYTYDYDVRTETAMDGASENKALLAIRGRADIEVISQCDLVLVLRDMTIYESSPLQDDQLVPAPRSQELRRVLEATPLRFSYQDGVVAELCPDNREDGWALNVKRGVLSALQNSMERLEGSETVQEADVTGRCQAKYEVTSNGWYTMSIKRSKDLLGCTDRHDYIGSIQTTPYQMASDLQSLPLMKSEHQCTQEVSSRILRSSTCDETHTFRPFSSQSGGARTTVTQRLTFKTEKRGVTTRSDGIQTRVQMPFDHGYNLGSESDVRARAQRALDQLCSVTEDGVHAEVPRMFSQLVGIVKKMDISDIRDIYNQLKSKVICSSNNQRTLKFFTDTLPMAGTSQSVAMMKELMIRGDVTGNEVSLWLMLLAFIKEPTSDMLTSVKELLSADALKQRAMLPVSALVNNYCKSNDDCDTNFGVTAIIAALEKDIGSSCYVNDNTIKTVLVALSALGNTGHSRATSIVTRCLSDRVPMEVRVAAARSFRRMPCDSDRSKLMDILKDGSEDAELRTAAYLQLMTCATPDILNQIQTVIEGEPDKSQLGSFVLTHLHNLQETSSPLKQSIKEMVKNVRINKEFDLNPVKFSRNYEKSAFLKLINTGAQAESNLIWSSQSSLPRSLSANLSVELFGHSVNLLEVGGRIEGLEYLMETLLSPYTFLGEKKASSSEKQARLDELKGSIYASVFGNELLSSRFQGINSLVSGKTFNVLDFLIKLSKDHDFSFTQSLQLLDSSMTVPTASGLPLTLSINATATVDVRAVGKMDLRKVSSSPRSLQIDGELRPSGAVSVDGVMSLDAKVTRTALKVSGTLHSSLALKGRVELERGKVLNVQIDMPDDKLDIIDIRSQFFIIRNGEEREQKMVTENRKEFKVCSGDTLARFSGLELCGELQFPNASLKTTGPFFPFTGPSAFSIVLYKKDTHTGYKLLAKRVENQRSSVAQLSFDTPGSTVVRAVSFDFMINYDQKEVEISMASPWKKVSLNGGVVNDAGLKSLTGTITVDDSSIYSITSEVKVENKDSLIEYTPVLEIVRPEADTIALRGTVQLDVKGRSLNSDLTLTGVTATPLQLQGTYTNTDAEKSVRGTFINGKKQYSLNIGTTMDIKTPRKGPVSFEVSPVITITIPGAQLVSFVGNAAYREDRSLLAEFSLDIPSLMDKASFKCNIEKKGRKSGPRYDAEIRFKSRPFTGKLEGQIVARDGLVTSKVTVDYSIQRVGADKLSINSKFSDKSTSAYRKYTLSTNLDFKQNPDWNVDVNVDVNHKKKHSGGELKIVYGKDVKDKTKEMTFSASLDRKFTSLEKMDIEYKVTATVPTLQLDAVVSGAHAHSYESLVSNINIIYAKDKRIEAAVSLRNKSDEQLKWVGEASLKYPGQEYGLETSIKEKSGRQFVYTMAMKRKGQQILSTTSSYKASGSGEYEITSEIEAEGYKRVQLTGSANTDRENLQLSSKLLFGKDTYGLSGLSKISQGPRGKWNVDLIYPTRHIVLNAEGGRKRNTFETDFEVAWDKDKDESAKVSLQASGTFKSSRDVTSTSGKLTLTTPFKPVNSLTISMAYDDDAQHYGLNGKMTLGDKSQQISSSLSLSKPLSLRNLQMTWEAETPFQGLNRMDASVAHSIDAAAVNTLVKVSKGQKSMELSVKALNGDVTFASRSLKSDVTFKSSLGIVEDISLSLSHEDDGAIYKCTGAFTRKGDRYQAQLDMNHNLQGWQLRNKGKLVLSTPDNGITTTWEHSNGLNDITCSLTSSWGSGRELKVDLSGSYENIGTTFTGSLNVLSPWSAVRDLSVTLSHDSMSSRCTHNSAVVLNGQKKASVTYTFRSDAKALNSDFALTWPWTEDITVKVSSKHAQYPYTGQAQVQWSPRSMVTVDASISSYDLTDIEGYARFTSPFQVVRSVMMKASHKQSGDDATSKINIDYGVRQTVNFELRVRPQTLTLARATLKLPWDKVSMVDAGYSFSGSSKNFDSSADFTVQPLLGKYSASLLLNVVADYMGKMRIATPHRQLPYAQLTVTSRKNNIGRVNNIEAEIAPRQIYSLNTVYSFAKPIIFSANVETPLEGYRKFAVSMKHTQEDSGIQTQAEVHYPPEQNLEGSFTMDWSTGFQGSLQLKTPFDQYRDNHISVRHDGDWTAFNSHAEVDVASQRASADAQFKYSTYSTDGKLVLNVPAGLDLIEVKVNKKGYVDDFKSSASLSYGSKKLEGKLNHKLNSRSLKTTGSFTSPFTENVDVSVEYKARNPFTTSFSASYGPSYSIASDSSLDLAQRDVTASSTLKYKLGSSEKVITTSVSKKGEWQDVSLSASLTSPFTEDISLQMDHNCQLPTSLRNTLRGNYGTQYSVLSENTYSYQTADLSASTSVKLMVDGLAKDLGASLSLRGDVTNANLNARASYNDQAVDLTGQLDTRSGVTANVRASTPFTTFEDVGASLSYSGVMTNFVTKGSLQYKTGMKIEHSITFKAQDFNVDLDASFTSPIPNMERIITKLQNSYREQPLRLSGSAQLTHAWGTETVTYTMTQDDGQLNGNTMVQINGQKFEAAVAQIPLTGGYRHSMTLKGPRLDLGASAEYSKSVEKLLGKSTFSWNSASFTAEGVSSTTDDSSELGGKVIIDTPNYQKVTDLTLKTKGDLNDLSVDLIGNYGADQASAAVVFKNNPSELSGSVKITTPLDEFTSVGASFKHSGDTSRFSTEGSVTYMDSQTVSSKVTFYRYNWRRIEATAQLNTPYQGFETVKAEYRHSGSNDRYTCSSSLEYGSSKISADLRAETSPKYAVALTLKSPFRRYESMVAEGSLESLEKVHKLSSSLDFGRGRYSLLGSVDMTSSPMTLTGKLATPFKPAKNVEMTLTHQGELDDFTTSAVFNSPVTDAIRGEVALKYTSPFDVNAAASLTSRISGMEDMRVEVKNTESGQKTGHVMVRWAPEQQVVVDGMFSSKDYWYNKEVSAEVAIVTPFEKLRSGKVRVEHSQTDKKYVPKVEVSLNGNTLLDADAELLLADNPSSAITVRKPQPMQVTAAMTSDNEKRIGDVFVNWNRNDVNQNIRFKTSAKNVKTGYGRDVEYTFKVIHPLRTLGASMSAVAEDRKVSSQGYLSWDEAANQKVFYDLQVSDDSQNFRRVYDANMKVGVPTRTLEATGQYTDNHGTSTLDTTFAWDADRDTTKQIGFTAKVTSGSKTKADLLFRLPAIGKEVRIDSEVAVNQGRTVWDGKTAVSYSTDSRKTLTLSSSLKDVSDSYSSGSNYSLALAIMHPYTDVDLSLTSHLGSTDDRYSASVDTWYLTSRRERKNMALRGEIDRLRRLINLQLVSPLKKVFVQGEVTSVDPYVIRLANRYDDNDVIQSDITVDAGKRSIVFQTSYDIDNPDNKLVLKAGYVNDSAISAELYRQQSYQKISDSLFAMRLNTSTLLHTRLAWRPQTLADFQDYSRTKAGRYTSAIKTALREAYDGVGEEIGAKYSAITNEMTSEFQPLLDLLEGELVRLAQQLEKLRVDMKRKYDRNDFYLKNMGDQAKKTYSWTRDFLGYLSAQYETGYISLVKSLRDQLQAVRSFPIRQKYQEALQSLITSIEGQLDVNFKTFSEGVGLIDDYLQQLKDGAQSTWDSVKVHPRVQMVNSRVRQLGDDYMQVLGNLGNRLPSINIPEEYTAVIYDVRDKVNGSMQGLFQRPEFQTAKTVANEVYQQGVWAYGYWQVEENIKQSVRNIAKLLYQLAEEELEELNQLLKVLTNSHVTVYDPENGEIQVELKLPVQLKSLSELPDVQPYLQEVQESVQAYIPDKSTVLSYINKYTPSTLWFTSSSASGIDDLRQQLEAFQPTVSRIRPKSSRRITS